MSWTSLDEDEYATSSSDTEDIAEPKNSVRHVNKIKKRYKNFEGKESNDSRDSRHKDETEIEESSYNCSLSNCQGDLNPFVQEPNSDNEINSRREFSSHQKLENLLTVKDERIRSLQKLINGQREQLYHFLNMSLKKETLIELQKTCRETEALNRNENICMALDKFKYDNNLPSEQTLVRENVSKTLMKIERLMRHQVRLVRAMESGSEIEEGKKRTDKEAENSTEINCFQCPDLQLTDVQKLLKSSKQIQGRMRTLKIELKKLSLIEQERIDLVERVYSMPSDQRQYYAHLTLIEREKNHMEFEVEKLTENYRDLKQKCCLLEDAEEELNKCIDSKIADLDLNKIKPGLETHLELMEMIERGELSLITMTKDEKGKLSDDFVKLYNENAEISERLKDFDKVIQERDDLKRQIEVLVENCYRLQSEVRSLRLASKTDDLLEELRKACLEREQLRTKLERLTKQDLPRSVLEICDQTAAEKIIEERDQLRLKIDQFRNMSKQLEHSKEVEKQTVLEISKHKFALLKQEEEIKDLVTTIDKLVHRVKSMRIKNPDLINPAEGIPEGPEMTLGTILSSEEEKRLEMIKNRLRYDKSKNFFETGFSHE